MASVWRRRRPIVVLLLAVAAITAAFEAEAQFRPRGRTFRGVRATPADIDGRFQFCRIAYSGNGWAVDSPRAEINLSIRLSELTKASVAFDAPNEPKYLTFQLTDEALFGCPFIMMTEVGRGFISEREAEQLRVYLLKGGFLWADDFWGEFEWDVWENEILRQALPDAAAFPIVDLPPTHPLFSTHVVIKETPQIASIGHWYNTNGGTSERYAESATVHTRAILDQRGNIMVLMTHNTDLGDSFEREGDDPQYFYTMSVPGYAFGINTLLYALTH